MQFQHRSKTFDIVGFTQNDHIYKNISRSRNFYEIDLLEYIRNLKSYFRSKNDKNIVVDVGANIGNHSIYFGSFIADHVIAIEPNPDILDTLRRNLALNIKNYTLCEYAVGEKKGYGSIEVPTNMSENIGSASIDLKDTKGTIEISTIDSVISSWNENVGPPISVSLIKIDVEGMESQVLKGAEQTILKFKPHIFSEAATNEELKKILNYLRPLGYRKLPGHWATTPVWHFSHKPDLYLIIYSYCMQLIRFARKVKYGLTKRFIGR